MAPGGRTHRKLARTGCISERGSDSTQISYTRFCDRHNGGKGGKKMKKNVTSVLVFLVGPGAQNTVSYGLPSTTTAHKYNDGPRERRFLTLSTAPPPPRLWGLRAVTSRRAHMLSVFSGDFSASAIHTVHILSIDACRDGRIHARSDLAPDFR